MQLLRRVPGARPLARRLRSSWANVRPLTAPRYVGGVPRVEGVWPNDRALQEGASEVGRAALSAEAAASVVAVLDKLTPVGDSASFHKFYRRAAAEPSAWRYADVLTTVWAASAVVRPSSYLEIGVLRGRSVSVLGANSPNCAIYGFDLWHGEYTGIPSPGPDFVRGELTRAGHRGDVTLLPGDSRKTVPEFLREHPGLCFDVINVDGDHSLMGASIDLANVLPRLKVGGVLVMDDLRWSSWLMRPWGQLVQRDGRFVTWEFLDEGFGVAAAVRVSE